MLKSIFRISTVLTAPSNLDEVLSKILDEVVDTIGFDRGIILFFDETKRYLEAKVVKNFSEEAAKRAFAVPLDTHKYDCIAGMVIFFKAVSNRSCVRKTYIYWNWFVIFI